MIDLFKYRMRIGEFFSQTRRTKYYADSALAEECGFSNRRLKGVLSGKSKNLDDYLIVAGVLGVRIELTLFDDMRYSFSTSPVLD